MKALGGGRTQWVGRSVEVPVESALDIGCAFGWSLGALDGKARERWGVDVDEEALRVARVAHPAVRFVRQSGTDLPFDAERFDVVVLSEVIEHVRDEEKQRIVDEAARVLKQGGRLLFSGPYAGLLAWLDPLDIKRRFPRLYRLYTRVSGYVPATAPEIGHRHISTAEIDRLFAGRFQIEEVRYCGLLTPVLTWVLVVGERVHLLPRRVTRALDGFRAWESGVSYWPWIAFNLRLRARKLATTRLLDEHSTDHSKGSAYRRPSEGTYAERSLGSPR